MTDNPFDNVKNQMGRCGIWCGSCCVGNGVMQLLSRRFTALVEGYGLAHWGPKDVDYDKLKSWLGAIADLEPCKGCLQNDGDPTCKLRPCALDKKLDDCTACENFGSCDLDGALQHMRSGAQGVGMRVKSPGDGPGIVERWTEELKGSWPSGALFLD
jgi:hypothetical protein